MCPVVHNDKFLIQDLLDHHGISMSEENDCVISVQQDTVLRNCIGKTVK